MRLSIFVPYEKAELYCEIWANSEKDIDFLLAPFEAARCTVCFGACELKQHLQKYGFDCRFTSVEPDGFLPAIRLELENERTASEEYALLPTPNGVRISGKGKAGVLYGCYEFLKLQGFRWYAPGVTGTVVPKELNSLKFPDKAQVYRPDYECGRGFDFENYSIESAETWLWMARNRLNVGAYSPKFYPLQKKLCITIKAGGHIFEKLLDPNRMLEDGKTIFESHRDWYGVRKDGDAVTVENCLRTQFCVSNPSLIAFLASELVHAFRTEWKYVERADIWGFDTWGNVCSCEACKALGNAADITLHFLAQLRSALNETEIKNRVRLISCAYEGTATLEPPKRPIPRVLVESGDCVVFYPINRCYAHGFADVSCPTNSRYQMCLEGWSKACSAMPIIIGEYYNVSKFEDLPLVFTTRICEDLPRYYHLGVRGITYMHFPLMNMGLRALAHLLYAELSWNIKADANAILQEYLERYYEDYAQQLGEIYELLESASLHCAQWRAWSGNSILSQLLQWDGLKPSKPLTADTHFTTHEDILASGEHAVSKLSKAMEQIEAVLTMDLFRTEEVGIHAAVNPVELRQHSQRLKLSKRLSEVRCMVRYGLETWMLMTAMVKLYDALLHDRETASILQEILTLYRSMDGYYIPLGSSAMVSDTVCKTALERTQLKPLAKKCIALYDRRR